jgi:DNA-binding ferritin-like protein
VKDGEKSPSFLFGEIMNAKITITVPMDKLNQTVCRMLENIAEEFGTLSADTRTTSKGVIQQNDILKQLKNIDDSRKKLALLDANLEDCYSILNGLVKYMTKLSDKENADSSTK